MEYALVFAMIGWQPTVLDYRGNLDLRFDPQFATAISFDEAERRMSKGNPPILFALPGGPVVETTEQNASTLLSEWREAIRHRDKWRARRAMRLVLNGQLQVTERSNQ